MGQARALRSPDLPVKSRYPMKKRIFAALLALSLTALTGCDWSTADPEDIFGTLTDYYNVEQKKQDVKLTSFALPYLRGRRRTPSPAPTGPCGPWGALLHEGLFAPGWVLLPPSPPWRSPIPMTPPGIPHHHPAQRRHLQRWQCRHRPGRGEQPAPGESSARYSGRLGKVSDTPGQRRGGAHHPHRRQPELVSRLDIPIVKSGTESSTFPTGTGPTPQRRAAPIWPKTPPGGRGSPCPWSASS